MDKKQLITTGVLLGAVVLTGVQGIRVANAATENDTLPPIVQRVAEKFNLNQDEVKKFVTEDRAAHREEMQAERKAEFTAKLDQLVTDGKITAEQKDKIVAKHNELDAKRDPIHENRELSREEMQSQMQALRTEMTDFLKSIGVDENLFPQKGPRGGQGGRGMGQGRGMHRGL